MRREQHLERQEHFFPRSTRRVSRRMPAFAVAAASLPTRLERAEQHQRALMRGTGRKHSCTRRRRTWHG